MHSAINIAQDASRSDVPPPPPVLPPRAPWLSDLSSSVCLKCSEEFGVFRRRHHCRSCGGLFCDSCSEKRVKGVPGYDPTKEERVCDICFYNDIAIAVVWNLMFSGWHMRYFDNYSDATTCYEAISDYASRVMLKVGSGLVHMSFYKNDKWKQKVMDYAYTQIRKVLPARIPLLWHNNISGSNTNTTTTSDHTTMSIPATLMRSQYRQGPDDGGVQQGAVPPAPIPLGAAIPPQPLGAALQVGPQSFGGNMTPRVPGVHDLQLAVLVVYRQSDGEATDHTWLYFPFTAKVEILEEAGRFLRNIPRLSYGGVLDMDGFMHHFTQAPGVQGNPQAFHQLFRSYLENISTILHVQRNEVGSAEDESSSDPAPAMYFSKLRPALDALMASDQQHPDGRVVLIDVAGNVVASKNCINAEMFDHLAREAGREVCRQQSLCVLIACGPGDASHVFQDMYTARAHMSRSTGNALFAVANNTTSPVLIQRDLYMTKDQALILKNAAVNKTMSLVNRQRIIAVPQTESDASTRHMSQAPECGICFLPYDVSSHKPCLCAKCGNSLCFTCIRSVSLCPFCRLELPVNGPWVTNVQLLQLLSGSSD